MTHCFLLKKGFQVTAIDASEKMVEATRAYSHSGWAYQQGHMAFENYSLSKKFNGIWACASLHFMLRLKTVER